MEVTILTILTILTIMVIYFVGVAYFFIARSASDEFYPDYLHSGFWWKVKEAVTWPLWLPFLMWGAIK